MSEEEKAEERGVLKIADRSVVPKNVSPLAGIFFFGCRLGVRGIGTIKSPRNNEWIGGSLIVVLDGVLVDNMHA